MNTNSICTSCSHESYCIHIQHSNDNIIQCEEFEFKSMPRKSNTIINTIITTSKVEEDFSGLCKNCSNRKDCMHTNKSNVLWHCEDYELQ